MLTEAGTPGRDAVKVSILRQAKQVRTDKGDGVTGLGEAPPPPADWPHNRDRFKRQWGGEDVAASVVRLLRLVNAYSAAA